jgi:Fur family ferric uptake transcriptional regulator
MSPSTAEAWLRDHSFRATRCRIALVRVLSHSKRPLTLAEIQTAAGDISGDFATVYRFVERLTAHNLLRVHYWQDRTPRYEWHDSCHTENSHHHHHVICRECGRAEEIAQCTLESLERFLSETKGFTELSHSLEFFGICPRCHKKNKSLPTP